MNDFIAEGKLSQNFSFMIEVFFQNQLYSLPKRLTKSVVFHSKYST